MSSLHRICPKWKFELGVSKLFHSNLLQNEAWSREIELEWQTWVTLVSEKGASSWPAALPLIRYGFTRTKSEIRLRLELRYGSEPKNLPAKCSCGEPFTVAHSLHCGKGGYTLRHDKIRDTFQKQTKDAYFNVEVEPKLQKLEGESFEHKSTCTEHEARLDIRANGLWDSWFSRTLFDVKILGHGNKFERISSNFNFEWTRFEFSKNRNKFESHCSNFELSIKRASDIFSISSSAPRAIGTAFVPILLGEV